jgi:micrococcal nuclease
MSGLASKASRYLLVIVLCILSGFVAIVGYSYFTRDKTAAPPATDIPEGLEEAVVKKVLDGDSFILADGREVRLIGIDAPEYKLEQPLCFKAKKYLKELIEGRSVLLEAGDEPKDKYGRMLCFAYRKGSKRMVSIDMIREGFAYMYFFPQNRRYFDQFLAVQQSARKDKKGLWSLPVEKEDFYYVSLNVTHRPSCERMKRARKKKTKYATREEALDTGAPPCRECRP